MNTLEIDLNKISLVVRNQERVPSELLNAHEGKPDQFNLLVNIIAEAQGLIEFYSEWLELRGPK